MRIARSAILALVATVNFACGAASGTPSLAGKVPPTSSSSVLSTVATTAAPGPAAPQPTADQAASGLIDAWRRGDRTAATRVALADAVAAMFTRPPSPVSARGCQQPIAQSADCSFAIGGTTLLLVHTQMEVAGGWVVASVDFEG